MKKFERKLNYIDGSVQGSLVRRIMLHWLSFLAIASFSFILLQALLGNPDLPLTDRIAKTVSEFALLGVLMLAILPAFVLDTIRFSNRFVGPIARLRRAFRELNEFGHCEPIKFRGNDFWQEVADEFNSIAARVHEPAVTNKDQNVSAS